MVLKLRFQARYILLFSFILFSISVNSQNLLSNGDFELGGNNVGFNINGSGYNLISTPFAGDRKSVV